MKRLLWAFMLILPLIGSAKIPDEEDIRRKIFDPTSKFYYINLMMRYNNLERLNDDEYHYLYYGFAFQENYKPTASNPSADELYASLAGLNTENPDQRQLEEIVIFCNRAWSRTHLAQQYSICSFMPMAQWATKRRRRHIFTICKA